MRGVAPQSNEVGSKSQESLLLQAVQRLDGIRTQWCAAHIHLSRMKMRNKLDYQLRIASNTFETAVTALEGQLFKLANSDLVFLYRKPQDISNAVIRLQYLLDEAYDTDMAEDSANELYTLYNLEHQYGDLVQAVQKQIELVHRRSIQAPERRREERGAPAKPETPAQPLDLKSLNELVEAVGRADLSNLIRKQTVYALLSEKPSVPLFAEKFISMEDLRRAVLPGHNLVSNRWLFQYMTESLDRRVLAFLIRNADTEITGAFSLNLNVSTILSPEFLTFDAGLTVNMRGSIVIEIQAIDILADMTAYGFARGLLADRGYRICLDGVTGQTFPFLDRKRLGADFLKLQWSPMLTHGPSAPPRQELQDLVDKTGRVCTVLCRVDQEEAVAFGRSLGIALYQGRYIDKVSSTVNRIPAPNPR
jgi:EAL domain-containing protein (putative c-di-GMP-specific phosphodiesterase class I)